MARYKHSLQKYRKSAHGGFTLIEIIIGIVMLSISLAIVSSLIAPTEEQSADNLLQIKAAELGQSLLNDISSRAFADNSDMTGGRIRCGEPVGALNSCTEPLGRDGLEGNNRANYNDVDDFHGYEIANDLVDPLDGTYHNFTVEIDVRYAGADLGLANTQAKRITVAVTTPLGTEIKFATHKANF